MKESRSERVAKKAQKKGAKKREPYRPWKKVGFWIGCFLYALTLPVFTNCFCLWDTIDNMGDGTFRYTDQAYLDLIQSIDACLIPEYGVDSVALRENYNVEDFNNSIKGDKVLINATKADGFFEATVTIELDEKYHVKEDGVKKNYKSIKYYVRDVKIHLSKYSTLYGYGVWLVVGVVLYVVVSVINFIVEKVNKTKEENDENVGNKVPEELPEGSSEENAKKEAEEAKEAEEVKAPDAEKAT